MADKNTQMLANIQETLRSMDLKKPVLSTLAQKGDDELVEQFMTENISLGKEAADTAQSQLYMASFWGLSDASKILLQNGTDPNFQNEKTRWTPLHAASFQEHGKVIMLLLEAGADPELEDLWGRTPKDFASASDKVWSFFAGHCDLDLQWALSVSSLRSFNRYVAFKKIIEIGNGANGCQRTTKKELIEKKVLQKSFDGSRPAVDYSQGRKSTASSLLRFDDEEATPGNDSANAYSAAINGDVLAGAEISSAGVPKSKQNKTSEQPSFSAWRS